MPHVCWPDLLVYASFFRRSALAGNIRLYLSVGSSSHLEEARKLTEIAYPHFDGTELMNDNNGEEEVEGRQGGLQKEAIQVVRGDEHWPGHPMLYCCAHLLCRCQSPKSYQSILPLCGCSRLSKFHYRNPTPMILQTQLKNRQGHCNSGLHSSCRRSSVQTSFGCGSSRSFPPRTCAQSEIW